MSPHLDHFRHVASKRAELAGQVICTEQEPLHRVADKITGSKNSPKAEVERKGKDAWEIACPVTRQQEPPDRAAAPCSPPPDAATMLPTPARSGAGGDTRGVCSPASASVRRYDIL